MDAHRRFAARQRRLRLGLVVVLGVVVAAYGVLVLHRPMPSVLGVAALAALAVVGRRRSREPDSVPELVEESTRLVDVENLNDLDVRPS